MAVATVQVLGAIFEHYELRPGDACRLKQTCRELRSQQPLVALCHRAHTEDDVLAAARHCAIGSCWLDSACHMPPALGGVQRLLLTGSTPIDRLPPAILAKLHTLSVVENCALTCAPLCLAYCTQLTDLSIRSCHHLTDVSAIAACWQLRRLNLSGCQALSDITPLTSLNTLDCLDLCLCRAIQVLPPLSAVTFLNLSYCEGLRCTHNIHGSLTRCSFAFCDLQRSCLPSLTCLRCIQRLDLSGNRQLVDDDLWLLNTLHCLQDLDFSFCCGITSLSQLPCLPRLHTLVLNYCSQLTCVHGLATSCPALGRLYLRGCNRLTDAKHVRASTRHLKHLNRLILR